MITEPIPAFLKISQERRAQAWIENPPRNVTPAFASPITKDEDPGTAALREEMKAKVTAKIKSFKSKPPKEDTKGKRWDARHNRWVDDLAANKSQPAVATEIAAPIAAKPAENKPTGDKHETLLTMLQTPIGATLKEIAAATGWQEKSAGARISGLKKTMTVIKDEATGRFRVAA